MGFLDGLWGKKSDDPLQDLDPKAREFLRRESPLKFDSKKRPSSPDDTNNPAVAAQAQGDGTKKDLPAGAKSVTAGENSESAVPKESLYPDGRYAHLWKTYRSQSDVENETKTDHEKLSDVLEAFKSRKAAIGAAALENCAEEQMDWSNCMRGGSLRARMTMCSEEVRKFEKCYNMQSRLLKSLGYLNAVGRSPVTDERIQLHADKLYHQMQEQDAAVETAKKEGMPIPKFEPVIPKQVVADAAMEDAASLMSEDAKKRVKDKLDKMSEREREAEKAAIDAEMRAKAEMVSEIKKLWKEQEAEREARRQKGEETIWDKATGAFGRPSGSSGDKS